MPRRLAEPGPRNRVLEEGPGHLLAEHEMGRPRAAPADRVSGTKQLRQTMLLMIMMMLRFGNPAFYDDDDELN